MTAFFKTIYCAIAGFFISLALSLRIARPSLIVTNFGDALMFHHEAFRLIVTPSHPLTVFVLPNQETDTGRFVDNLFGIDGHLIAVRPDSVEIWDYNDKPIELSTTDKYVLNQILANLPWRFAVSVERDGVRGKTE